MFDLAWQGKGTAAGSDGGAWNCFSDLAWQGKGKAAGADDDAIKKQLKAQLTKSVKSQVRKKCPRYPAKEPHLGSKETCEKEAYIELKET